LIVVAKGCGDAVVGIDAYDYQHLVGVGVAVDAKFKVVVFDVHFDYAAHAFHVAVHPPDKDGFFDVSFNIVAVVHVEDGLADLKVREFAFHFNSLRGCLSQLFSKCPLSAALIIIAVVRLILFVLRVESQAELVGLLATLAAIIFHCVLPVRFTGRHEIRPWVLASLNGRPHVTAIPDFAFVDHFPAKLGKHFPSFLRCDGFFHREFSRMAWVFIR